MNDFILFIKQLFCQHEWHWIDVSPELVSKDGRSYRLIRCPKCGKIIQFIK